MKCDARLATLEFYCWITRIEYDTFVECSVKFVFATKQHRAHILFYRSSSEESVQQFGLSLTEFTSRFFPPIESTIGSRSSSNRSRSGDKSGDAVINAMKSNRHQSDM